MRLNLYLSKAGVASRRKSDELIFEGKVKVNNEVITAPGTIIDENKDSIYYNNKLLKIENLKYFIFNKPINVVTTVKDPQKRKTVVHFFNKESVRLFPVGRLDYDSTGLIFMTNDGDFSNKLMHPSKNKNKVYIATVNRELSKKDMNLFSKGIKIENKKTSNSQIKLLNKKGRTYNYKVIIHEGMNRQIRKMFKYFNVRVIELKRVEIAGVKLGNLKEGDYRKLTKHEYNKLMEIK